ncbi:MAG: nucleotidyltransferase family protein [Deltaproteobacteria bacterium]|nr:nucleotidyltransferase family protein [Deltaproteobacteria bacterium]
MAIGGTDALSPPEAFVRACLRLRVAPASLAAAQAAAAALDGAWDAVRAIADAERLGPLLHASAGSRGLLPPALAAHVHRRYRESALRNRLLFDALTSCARALRSAGVPVIVLKGTALAATLYGDAALRPMVDLDLLVHPRHRGVARQVLERLGYVASRPEVHPGALIEHESEIDLQKPGAVPTHVDLHWGLFDSPHYQHRIEPEWLWRTAIALPLGSETVQGLAPAPLVLHLSGHLMLHHGGHGLLWWHDLSEVVVAHADRLDWEELLARARRYDLQLVLRRVLTELAVQWQAPVPPAVLAALQRCEPRPQEAWLFDRLAGAPRPAGERFWTDLVSTVGWGARWRFAVAHLFPTAAYMRQRYAIRHPLLVPLYYPYRWWRGIIGA